MKTVDPVPLIVRCSCGHTMEAESGQTVECVCGEVYETNDVGDQRLSAAVGIRNRQKSYVRMGVAVVALSTVIGFFVAGFWGAGIALPLTCAVWWKKIQPHFKAGAESQAAAIPTATVRGRKINLKSDR